MVLQLQRLRIPPWPTVVWCLRHFSQRNVKSKLSSEKVSLRYYIVIVSKHYVNVLDYYIKIVSKHYVNALFWRYQKDSPT